MMSLLPVWAIKCFSCVSFYGGSESSQFNENILISVPKMTKVLRIWNDMKGE